ncbi:MAG TPA: undecaprenyldiphospho-muramoylpentapeptide beta-N-acetylglucosaminyltransferase [Candidatus Rubrimentiphilum sp.]|nr:undecaprenyldiphospho-muramoylpentapeptide beta-N-acetylglucosaminyltransferase [Candidatus Rubrimentiphilum sp.]
MNVAFTGGGTGGHIYPAIAIADALRDRAQILFIGNRNGLEQTIVPDAGYDLASISSRSLQRRSWLETPAIAAVNAAGIAQSWRVLRSFRPDIVIATGGYVSFPAMTAARAQRLVRQFGGALALLEPNAHPGLTNRWLARVVDEVWGAFPQADPIFATKYVHTGVPVRGTLLHPNNRIEAARRLGLDPSRRTLLAIGGSQGARSINEAIAALVTRRALPPEWQILHVAGERDYEYMQAAQRAPFGENRVVLVPYLREMADAYAISDLVIARAGASTLGELAALGIPALLIPYPFAAEDHQARNATVLAQHGAAVTIEDRALNADSLWWTLREVMQPEKLDKMRAAARSLGGRDAVATIVARVEALVSQKQR